MVACGLQCAARHAVTGLLLLVMLFAQAGGALAIAPHQAALTGQPEIQTVTAQADRSYQSTACDDHGDATCCMHNHCQSVAGFPAYVPSTFPDAVTSLTRYAGTVVAHRDGHAAGPTPPPPRSSV